ncbi:serine acetyltransferase [Alistipes provencensis]|uniref:serine acetyltransferase n=1 Tax=Alistipes provencensis TaxID=1816676 RepID=UPI0007EE23F8|nr:serine acetyltransferase [Alistipes provencensis]
MDITTLKTTLAADAARFNEKPCLKDWLLGNEGWFIYHYIRHMRYVEYYMNKGILYKPLMLYHLFFYKRLGARLRMAIYPGTTGPGLRIYHTGSFLHIGPNVHIGKNCTIVSGLVFGNKTELSTTDHVYVGDNCYFGINTTVLGTVKIGDNVTVGAHAVVVSDVPSGSTAVGIPAKLKKSS